MEQFGEQFMKKKLNAISEKIRKTTSSKHDPLIVFLTKH